MLSIEKPARTITLTRSKILLILIVLIPITDIDAQFSAGMFGGVNYSGLIGDAPPRSTYRARTGYAAGVFGEYKIFTDVGVSIQPMFIQKGAKIAYSSFDKREPQDSLEIAINYFSMPVLMKVYAGNEIMYVSGGFDIGYKLDASFRKIATDTEKEIGGSFKDFNIAAIVGVGAQFRLSHFYIFVEGRYSQGLGNISSTNPDDPKEINPSFRTNGLQLFAGVYYSFGGYETEN